MGDLVFGGGFEAMRNGAENEPVMHAIEKGLKCVRGFCSAVGLSH